MTTIDNNLVDKIAHLARLQFEDQEREEIKNDLNKMLAFVEQLNSIDTSNVEPLIYVNEETNIFRADTVANQVSHKEAMQNAPQKDTDYFRVPKVINNED
jgi:aspartyl-tRNA(Asn)/glutamyl-tRNA(Gln) amidotransferase subunit C